MHQVNCIVDETCRNRPWGSYGASALARPERESESAARMSAPLTALRRYISSRYGSIWYRLPAVTPPEGSRPPSDLRQAVTRCVPSAITRRISRAHSAIYSAILPAVDEGEVSRVAGIGGGVPQRVSGKAPLRASTDISKAARGGVSRPLNHTVTTHTHTNHTAVACLHCATWQPQYRREPPLSAASCEQRGSSSRTAPSASSKGSEM